MKFGTSGLRGLVTDLLGPDTARYVAAFGNYLKSTNQATLGAKVYVGGDLRPSTPQIMAICIAALEQMGLKPVDCGFLPTPALALHAMTNNSACLMVTGSHIPADRNGIKFYTPSGEITKADEYAISDLAEQMRTQTFHASTLENVEREPSAESLFIDRNRMLLSEGALANLKVGVYQHSTVARDSLVSILEHYGAQVIALGRSDEFVPVDTEAVPEALIKLLRHWAGMHQLHAILSADGDGDRPLVTDEAGEPVRGDALGILVARFLSAASIATPVTTTSGLETSGPYFVVRTKVGSPYVIEGMRQMIEEGSSKVMGFEANGGVLTASVFDVQGSALQPLPTRDSFLPILAALNTAASENRSLSKVVEDLKLPAAISDRIQNYPFEKSARLMSHLRANSCAVDAFFASIGRVRTTEHIDGVRVKFENQEILHIRPSGNAPEMRFYVEAGSKARASALLEQAMRLVAEAEIV